MSDFWREEQGDRLLAAIDRIAEEAAQDGGEEQVLNVYVLGEVIIDLRREVLELRTELDAVKGRLDRQVDRCGRI